LPSTHDGLPGSFSIGAALDKLSNAQQQQLTLILAPPAQTGPEALHPDVVVPWGVPMRQLEFARGKKTETDGRAPDL
jgi:hypothetical protein